ncbi:MAG: hypothetical protein B6I25_06000 [Planctomycetales bacterium 4572_13]|nr:MAG: hypothetical protein B6I25_06000 [Planctomycetales bacterium 4572_13]
MLPPYEELFDSSVAPEQHNWTPDALAAIPICKGVLLFADSKHQPVQLLQTANLRRAAHTKLLQQDEIISKKTDISELTNKIFWRCCYNDFMTQTAYVQLAHVLFGKQADNWIHLRHPYFSVIEMDSRLPYFDASTNPVMSEKRIVYGPFPNRKAAVEFSKTLNSVFCLCQNPTLLKTQSQSSCPYLQMMKCPKPCMDPTQKEIYLKQCDKATEVANRYIESSLKALGQQMDKASNAMAFEKANGLKKQINRLENLKKPNYRWVHNLKNLSILHLDRTVRKLVKGQRRRIQQYQWVKIDSEAIYDLGDFSPTSRQDINCFLEQNWTTGVIIPFAGDIGKHLANLAFFLYRSNSSGLWLDCSDGIDGNQLYAEMERFLDIELPLHSATNKDAE